MALQAGSSTAPPASTHVAGCRVARPTPPLTQTHTQQVEIIHEGDHVNDMFLLVVGHCMGERGERHADGGGGTGVRQTKGWSRGWVVLVSVHVCCLWAGWCVMHPPSPTHPANLSPLPQCMCVPVGLFPLPPTTYPHPRPCSCHDRLPGECDARCGVQQRARWGAAAAGAG